MKHHHPFQATESFAQDLDRNDELARFRDQFYVPVQPNGQACIYFCGNSLGLQPKTVRDYVEQELADWQALGVEGHFKARHPWMHYHTFLTEQTAKIVGALPIEVVVMNTLTVNLHLMLVSFYRPSTERYKILIEGQAFPSDRYAVQSHLQFHGLDPQAGLIEIQPRPGEHHIRTEDIVALLQREGKSIALVLLGGVNYYTGQAFDMRAITQAAHPQGCMVGFDLAHAVGNLILKLHEWEVDFAVWCSYKYLNGGPGSIGGCFVHERHARRRDLPRFAGWWGHDPQTRFDMPAQFNPMPGAEGWQLSNPPILPMAALRASLDIFEKAGMERLRAKSEKLTGYLEFMLDQYADVNFRVITPADPHQRGAQLSIKVNRKGRQLFEKLIQSGIICDWREPDVIRVAPVPLYNTFSEVFRFVEQFVQANQRVLDES